MTNPRDEIAPPDDGDSEKPSPAPSPDTGGAPFAIIGDSPDDDDDEDAHAAVEGAGAELDPRHAYEALEIRTPLEEFETYARARIETLVKLGENDRAEMTAKALEIGRRALARVTGVPLPPRETRAGS